MLLICGKMASINLQSPPLQTSACHPCCLCVPRWETCPGTRFLYGDESCRYAAGVPPACPCRPLAFWGDVPDGGGRPGPRVAPRASWTRPSSRSPPRARRAPLWPPRSPQSRASAAARAAASHHLQPNTEIDLRTWNGNRGGKNDPEKSEKRNKPKHLDHLDPFCFVEISQLLSTRKDIFNKEKEKISKWPLPHDLWPAACNLKTQTSDYSFKLGHTFTPLSVNSVLSQRPTTK